MLCESQAWRSRCNIYHAEMLDHPGKARASGPRLEVRVGEGLTISTARAVAETIARQLDERPATLWLNLEAVKTVDVVGLAVVAQAVRRAQRSSTAALVFPSAAAYRGLVRARLHQLPLDKRRAWERDAADAVVHVEPSSPSAEIARTARLSLTPATWDDLECLDEWARDDVLEQMVGSELLAMCRGRGAYDPGFVTEATASPTSLTLLIRPAGLHSAPVGFVRLCSVNFAHGFAFLETAIAPTHAGRPAWGIEASRLLSHYAFSALRLHRLEAKVYSHNPSSIDGLKHHGFVLEGRLREAYMRDGWRTDVLVFGILESEIRVQLASDELRDMGFWPDELA